MKNYKYKYTYTSFIWPIAHLEHQGSTIFYIHARPSGLLCLFSAKFDSPYVDITPLFCALKLDHGSGRILLQKASQETQC